MKLSKIIIAGLFIVATSISYAEEDAEIASLITVNDFDVTNLHFAIFNAQKNPEATSADTQDPQKQIDLLNELVHSFMVANSEEGKAFAENPEVAATIQVANARLIAQAMIRDRLRSSPVSDEEIATLYKETYEDKVNFEYKASHILVETQESAVALIEELKKGSQFSGLAKEHSTGPSKSVGGDLGWFTASIMTPPFAAALEKLEDGNFSEAPVKTDFGWHVILRENSKELPAKSLASVRSELEGSIRQTQLADYMRKLRDRSSIIIHDGK